MTDTKQPRKRLRFRRLTSFSLRTALIAITVLAVGLGVLTMHMRSVKKQRAAIAAVKRHGGTVDYDYQRASRRDQAAESPVSRSLRAIFGRDHFHSVVSVHMRSRATRRKESYAEAFTHLERCPKIEKLLLNDWQLTDEELEYVGQIESLRELEIRRAHQITDQGVAHLANLKELERLRLKNAQITDESLEVLAQLSKLHELELGGKSFTDTGLSHLQNMTQLESLHFEPSDGKFTDEGLVYLRRLTQLKRLVLCNADVTDEALVHLKRHTQLKELTLADSKVTDEGLRHLMGLKNLRFLALSRSEVKDEEWLQERLPNCKMLF